VERFDYDQRKASSRAWIADYYTDAIDYTQVKVLEEVEGEPQTAPAARMAMSASRARSWASED